MHILGTSIKSFSRFIILSIIFLLPFSGVSGFSFLGELKNDASAHVLVFLGFPLFLFITLQEGKIKLINHKYYFLLVLVVILILFSSLISFSSFDHTFKEKNGYEKFVLQYGLLIFYSIFVCHFAYHTLSDIPLEKILTNIRKVILASHIVVLIYALLEIFHLYGVDTFTPLLEKIDWIIRSEPKFRYLNLDRIRSVTPEPPFLTLYLVFATPWLLSYLNSDSGKHFKNCFLLASIFILVYYSGSRSGLLVITFEIFLFFGLQFRLIVQKQKFINAIYLAPLLAVLLIALVYFTGDKIINKIQSISVNSNSELQVSSISRWSTQEAALQIALDNPFFGVGLGQQGFYFPSYYSKWSYEKSYEIKNWSDNNHPTWPPGFSMLTRLAAEAGFLISFSFFILNFLIIIKLFHLHKRSKTSLKKLLAIVCLITLAGYILIYLQWDSFRLTGYWITLALSFALFKNE